VQTPILVKLTLIVRRLDLALIDVRVILAMFQARISRLVKRWIHVTRALVILKRLARRLDLVHTAVHVTLATVVMETLAKR
jgi:hypothetical protein